MKKYFDKIKIFRGMLVVVIILAFFIGLWVGSPGEYSGDQNHNNVEVWTCSMHPSVNLPEPVPCPICFMDLIPVEKSSHSVNLNEITLSEDAQALAQVETVPVKRGEAHIRLNVSGKVNYDETKIKSITSWVSGRIERLFVDYTGISVKSGDHLVELYSPELYSAQEEFLQSVKLAGSDPSLKTMLTSSREKLRLLGLTQDQIETIEKRKTPSDRITIYSPISGVVINKTAVEGKYVKTGTPLFEVVDLSKVWVKLDVYESEISLIHYGQEVSFTTAAHPGTHFTGKVVFINPMVDEETRTVQVRLNVDNASGLLKPGMFTNAVFKAKIDSKSKVLTRELAGKWVCPMHPEEIYDTPEQCSICGMNLETAESLGMVYHGDSSDPLLIPVTAVLLTGERAVVYVKTNDDTFESREISLGQKAGDHYIINSGLHEGERVVVKGNFKIDSAMQIEGKPSMMNSDNTSAKNHSVNHQH